MKEQFVKKHLVGGSMKWVKATVWPDWAIYYTLGNFSKPMARIILPKLPTYFRQFL